MDVPDFDGVVWIVVVCVFAYAVFLVAISAPGLKDVGAYVMQNFFMVVGLAVLAGAAGYILLRK